MLWGVLWGALWGVMWRVMRRVMAKAVGVSESTVGKIWRVHGLKPHLSRTFKLSNDKRFAEKLEDVVGLYLSPPENAIVLSCDEKSQMQALAPLKSDPRCPRDRPRWRSSSGCLRCRAQGFPTRA